VLPGRDQDTVLARLQAIGEAPGVAVLTAGIVLRFDDVMELVAGLSIGNCMLQLVKGLWVIEIGLDLGQIRDDPGGRFEKIEKSPDAEVGGVACSRCRCRGEPLCRMPDDAVALLRGVGRLGGDGRRPIALVSGRRRSIAAVAGGDEIRFVRIAARARGLA
jgi:hypothetical protein